MRGSAVRHRILRSFAVVAVVGTGVAAITSAVVAVIMARTIVTPPKKYQQDMTVLALSQDPRSVDVSVTPDALLEGNYSLWFANDTGHATVGEILATGEHRVTRRLLDVRDGELTVGVRCRFASWFYMSPKDLGLPYREVAIHSDVGSCPAWLIPASGHETERSRRWVIQVHGRATKRSEGLRAVPVFRDAGFSSLLVSYRNDGDAPGSPDGRYGLGDTEWLDVEAAIRYAAAHGAQDIVLMGWSMGGATSLQAVTRSDAGHLVTGLVLESPVVEWADTLAFQAKRGRVPRLIGVAALAIIGHARARLLTGQNAPIDLKRLDFVTRAAELDVPILLLHSDDDGYVPSAPSRALALAREDIVTLVPFVAARHTRLWNYDSQKWNAAIAQWLSQR